MNELVFLNKLVEWMILMYRQKEKDGVFLNGLVEQMIQWLASNLLVYFLNKSVFERNHWMNDSWHTHKDRHLSPRTNGIYIKSHWNKYIVLCSWFFLTVILNITFLIFSYISCIASMASIKISLVKQKDGKRLENSQKCLHLAQKHIYNARASQEQISQNCSF